MDADAVLDGLNDAQQAAVTTPAAPLCILAGAGSGKTRVLTRRIAHRVTTGDAEPHRILALTFTRKAAGELRSRLGALGLRDAITAGTFHGIALAQLRTLAADRGDREPQILDRKYSLVARNIPRQAGRRDVNPLDAISEIEWAKARAISPQRYADEALHHGRRPPLPAREMAEVYQRYEQDKDRRGMVDFDDLLHLCERALTSDPTFAAAQRWRFRHFFVDEFQDVNPLQYRLLRAWLGGRPDVCVVGDPRQAIYAWNGADAAYLNEFARHFPGGQVLELRDNYRSSPQILAVANAIIAGHERGSALRPNRPPDQLPEIVEFATDADEARGIARAVRDANAPGRPWQDQAVLARTNAQAALIADALGRARIPHRLRGDAPLTSQPEVKAALRQLRSARVPLAVALADLDAQVAGHFGEDLTTEPGSAEAEGQTEGEEERQANLAALVQLGQEYLGMDAAANASGFESWLQAVARSDDAGSGDAVEVATFHAAKGLEWPIVHVAGVESGLVPIGHAKTPEPEAEERRLFYVAVTRAERVLRLTWAAQRSFGSRVSNRQPSPYLSEVRTVLAALAAGRDPADNVAEVRKERRRLRAGNGSRARSGLSQGEALSGADQAVFDALKTWRLEQARAANVPAYVIFPDATLQAVASARPMNIAGLLSISGIGKVKATRYGDALLGVVAAHAPADA